MALSSNQIAAMYDAAKRVHESKQQQARALDALENIGISRAVATDSIRNFRHMMHGERYRRTLTGATTEFMLDSILRDYGQAGLKSALSSLQAHIAYLETQRGSVCRQERALHSRFSALITSEPRAVYPDDVPTELVPFIEGAAKQVVVNQYERDQKARAECIRHWGTKCYVCRFDFEKTYGPMGRGFIHVHHLTDIATIGVAHKVNPIADLRPVCPNCHAMLHTERPAIDIEVLKSMMDESGAAQKLLAPRR